MKYSIHQIASTLGINNNLNDSNVNILLVDSRQLLFPSETLFFALKTKSNDGHKYINELYEKGVRNFVISEKSLDYDNLSDANFLFVENTLDAMQQIAAFHRKQFAIPIIGITGSNGKTIVKEWLYQTLWEDYNITRAPRSYNSQIGVPLSVWQLNESSELGIFEAGISEKGEMAKLQKMICPSIGIITNIGQAHQENFSSLKEKCLEKLNLFIDSNVIICEEENELIRECMQQSNLSKKRITWSRNKSSASFVHILAIDKQISSTTIRFQQGNTENLVVIPFVDDASIEDAIHVLTTLLYLHISIDEIARRMLNFEPVAMRLDVREGRNNCTLINDSYNSDFNSLSIALDFLVQRATNTHQEKVVILSDIPQTGLGESEIYQYVSTILKQKEINRLIGIGANISSFKSLFKDIDSHFYDNIDDFIKSNYWKKFQDNIILLKGARNFHFEVINKLLEEKTHETVLDVNLDAIVHNYKFFRSIIKPETKLICMVKADGYGTGSTEVAKTLQYHKCDYLAVAVAEEGVNLRKNGISLPIIILNAECGGFEELATYSLEPEIYNFRILDAYIKDAKQQGVVDYPIHLKIDSGMHRLGFGEEDIPELIGKLKKQNALRVKSIFSHLAASESWSFDDFTHEQIDTFNKTARVIEEGVSYPIWKHILNSAGIERFPEHQMDMVRLGISLYGVSASSRVGLQNVCTLKTTVLQIKHIKKGETVGYGRKGHFDHDAKIATLRIGYADGLSRQFGNGIGKVWVKGHLVPIVGNVCMDLTMIDITGLDVQEGDYVVLFGEELPITDHAQRINTIPYEILTSISPRVKHIYYKE